MKASLLPSQIRQKNSYLCVGLDPDVEKLPDGIPKSAQGVLEFCLQIIEKTLPFTVSYKLNTAFFESLGAEGWKVMEILFMHLQSKDVFAIADAKRADIGNTSHQYAKAFFENMGADAITLSPYMGFDSIQPFLEFPDKTAILLALTSNPGHADFEMQPLANGRKLYEEVLVRSQTWERKGSLMYVVGATRSTEMESVRALCPDSFLLVPGVGAQGGDLREISEKGMNASVGLLVNASRSILYASSGSNYAMAASKAAFDMQQEMERYLRKL
ncbi:MAG TPA: orotidine-5'-phosphate decarboxylase [Catalimonadaceae bacterium]|nr:orotidine-5'-phosphate decarboxylase [Catalimonadaceae bacterium]